MEAGVIDIEDIYIYMKPAKKGESERCTGAGNAWTVLWQLNNSKVPPCPLL
jgi:hypothetical protein